MKRIRSFTSSRHIPPLVVLLTITVFVSVFFASRESSSSSPTTTASTIAALAVGQQSTSPDKIVGRNKCQECHSSEFAAWEASTHGKGAWKLLDDPKAADFAKALKVADVHASVCAECHGTKTATGFVKGNSCESCHGGAGGDKGWLKTHCDYGSGADKKMAELLAERASESAAHRQERLSACADAGLNGSEDPISVARNCLQCHIVPNETLIAAKHPSSAKFEFVQWSQGEVRHNFVLSQDKNAKAPTIWQARAEGRTAESRERLMFVAGQIADLQVSLQARANVTGTKRNTLGDMLNDRIVDAAEELEDLVKDGVNELKPVLGVLKKHGIDKKSLKKVGKQEVFIQAAADVGEAGKAFLKAHKDGSKLPKVKTRKAKGDVFKG